MNAFGMAAATFVGLTLTAAAGRGDGGPPTAPPSDTGGGTTGGSGPGATTPEWKLRILGSYEDGSMCRSERKEMIRFLHSLPRADRLQCLLSWARLQRQVAGNANPAVVGGLVATWAYSDPDAATAWLLNQGRGSESSSSEKRAIEGFEGEIHQSYRNGGLYYIPSQVLESLPLKWTTGVNVVWEDGTVSRSEFQRLLTIARSLPREQRALAIRHWLMLRKSAG